MITSNKIVEVEADPEGRRSCYDGRRPGEAGRRPRRTAMITHTVSYLRFHSAPRQTVAVFREQIGLPPKRYARVIRFRRALSLLHEGGRSLAEVATTVGYHDQPHMNRDFRELGGLAPGEFLGMTRYSPTTMLG
jgi:methylphosphotriester-DNA--protein-cysteine methyltransferase